MSDPAADPRPAALPEPAAASPASSPAAQDCLKTIWGAGEWATTPVTTTLLATRLGVSPSTVSEQVRKLAERGLVHHTPYGPIELTESGGREALRIVRRHRLLEAFLVAELDYTWDQVHAEAELLEHVVSDLLVERIDVKLGRPARDPHGDPIPAVDGSLQAPAAVPLRSLGAGRRGVVARISDSAPGVLRWCQDAGLRLDAEVTVVATADAVLVETAPPLGRLAVPSATAAAIWLTPLP